MNRCVPKEISTRANALYSGTGMQTFAEEVVADVKLSWKEIIYMTLIAFGRQEYAAKLPREKKTHTFLFFISF